MISTCSKSTSSPCQLTYRYSPLMFYSLCHAVPTHFLVINYSVSLSLSQFAPSSLPTRSPLIPRSGVSATGHFTIYPFIHQSSFVCCICFNHPFMYSFIHSFMHPMPHYPPWTPPQSTEQHFPFFIYSMPSQLFASPFHPPTSHILPYLHISHPHCSLHSLSAQPMDKFVCVVDLDRNRAVFSPFVVSR